MADKKAIFASQTEQTFPKAEDVCKIVLACKEAGVSSLKCGPLEVSFVVTAQPPPLLPQNSGPAPTPAGEVPEKIIQAQQQVETASHIEQEIQTREQQVAELMVTDPLLAEQLMMEGELELAGESKDGTSAEDGTLD